MRAPRLLAALGALLVVAGLVWAAQGAGLLPYPRASFMVGAGAWVPIGLGTAAVGAVVLWAARRR